MEAAAAESALINGRKGRTSRRLCTGVPLSRHWMFLGYFSYRHKVHTVEL